MIPFYSDFRIHSADSEILSAKSPIVSSRFRHITENSLSIRQKVLAKKWQLVYND